MDIYKSTLQKMFSNRHLKREVMLGNIKDLEKIKLYLKKVKVF